MPDDPRDAGSKGLVGRQETDDQKRFGAEVKKISGMRQYSVALEKRQHELLLGCHRRHTEYCIPAAVGVEPGTSGVCHRGADEVSIVRADPDLNLLANH